ncbi:MAG: glycine cleavage system protein H [Acidobacteria bacterium]|nr:glycine cleavage system protein H [Acidobacteriota bacterium]|tara:strand:- start:552 stop:947 length:396 start_codon:yes stop_codon:yes gene_type:complete
MYPDNLLYTREHEWVEVSDNGTMAQVGITDYAQQQLGDVVFVELPEVGQKFAAGAQFGSIESVKAVSDLYCPLAGKVVQVNADLIDRPESVNQLAHETWIIELELEGKPGSRVGVERLLNAREYGELVESQ